MSTLHVLPDPDAVSQAAAEFFCDLSSRAQDSSRRFRVALSGGSTPINMYRLLAREPLKTRVRWAGVDVFWGDERAVGPEEAGSNFGAAKEALLGHVPATCYRIKGELPPEEAASLYELKLREVFGIEATGGAPEFDLILLGLGGDGHTASLFPGSGALRETQRLVVPAKAPTGITQRVTLTLGTINSARAVAFMVTGAAKASVLREVFQKNAADTPPFPAGLVQPIKGELHWFLDKEAASALRR